MAPNRDSRVATGVQPACKTTQESMISNVTAAGSARYPLHREGKDVVGHCALLGDWKEPAPSARGRRLAYTPTAPAPRGSDDAFKRESVLTTRLGASAQVAESLAR
jgi:hypothetical protein